VKKLNITMKDILYIIEHELRPEVTVNDRDELIARLKEIEDCYCAEESLSN